MKELIYYPGFEIRNMAWLKFALLYIEKLWPIIPESGDKYLNNKYKYLIQHTDLINIYRPHYEEGIKATVEAIDFLEHIMEYPDDFIKLFGNNYLEKWRNQENQNYTLFEEKYTNGWRTFCNKNSFSRDVHEGILINKDLCYIFMTFLAQAISDQKGLSPITDDPYLDKFSIFSKKAYLSEGEERFLVAQGILNLKLPANINQIPLENFIKLRNSPRFMQKQMAFHQELNYFLSDYENGKFNQDSVNSFEDSWNDFFDPFFELGVNFFNYGLGVWLLINSPIIATAQYMKEILGASLLLYVGSTITIRRNWRGFQTRRYSRKFLADIEGILNEEDQLINNPSWMW